MSVKDSIIKSRRQVYIVITTLIILIFFIGLYFSKYVPGNKEELNQRGFRILEQIVENIENKNVEYKNRLSKNILSDYVKYTDTSKHPKNTDSYRDSIIQDITSRIIANDFVYAGPGKITSKQ